MKKPLLLLFLVLIAAWQSSAQNVASYIFSAFPGTYTNITGGTAVTTIQADDQYTTGIPIGFTFQLSGVNYTTVRPSSNGWLSLGTPANSYLTNDLGNLANIVPAFMPLWDDLDGASGSAFYQTTGVAPNRVFTFEWRNWEWNFAGPTAISFQVKLFETTNVIQYVYRQEAGTPNNPSATIALARTTTDYQSLPGATATPIPSTTTFTTSIGSKPATDQIYQWAPPPPCSGQPLAGSASFVNGCPSSVMLTGYSAVSNLTFQWQKRTCGGAWTDLPNSNTYFYNLGPTTGPTEYRAFIICNNSGLSDTSNIVNVTSVAPCYCTPGTTSCASNDMISNVTFAAINNNSQCSPNGYGNYTATVPTQVLSKGSTYPISVTVTNGGTEYVGVWVDFNQNGTFDATEFTHIGSIAGGTVSNLITVPVNAATGPTTMRVRVRWNQQLTGSEACIGYTFGETEDYPLYIQYTPTVTGGGVYCAGDNVSLIASAPGMTNPVYLWTGPNGQFISSNDTVTFPNIQPTNNGNYTVRMLTYPCGGVGTPDTSGATVLNVYVNPLPAKPIVAPVIVYCQGDVFDSIPIYGQNLKWYSVPTGGVATTTPPVINTSVFGTVTYYVSQTVNNCEGPRAEVTINVVPKPAPPQVVTPVGYCQGDTPVPLVANGQNIRWYSVPAGGVGTPVTPTPGTNAQGTFTWYASQTVAGCESDRVPVEVNVSYIPNALITLSKPFVCQYDTISLGYFGNATPTADYVWTMPNGATTLSGSGQGPLVVRFDTSGNMVVRLRVDNSGCVGPEATVVVPVHVSPRFALDIQPDACKDEIVNLAVTNPTIGIDNFNWNAFDGGEMVYGAVTAGPYGVRWSTPGEKIIKVVATDDGCRSLDVFDTITIHDLPNAMIQASKTEICSGDTIEFRAAYDANSSYQWEPYQFFGPSHSNVDTGIVDFTGYVTLHVTNEYNCRASDSLLVSAQPCCDIYFPNAFSPNNDGRNDNFGVITKGTHQISVFRVANRWGQTVFETGDELRRWDGTFNGVPQDMGTYFYYVKYKCSDGNYYEDKGELTLVR